MAAESSLRVLSFAAASLLVLACGPDSTVSGETAGTTGVDEPDCVQGADGCVCTPDDGCGGGFACIAGTCDHSPLPAPGPAPSELNPPDGGPCSTDADCTAVEFCEGSTCVHAWNRGWVVNYVSTDPLGCPPSIATKTGELVMGYFSSEDFHKDSIDTPQEFPTTIGCPFVWEDPKVLLNAFTDERRGAHFVFQLQVEPEVSGPSTRMARWCWDTLHTGECGPIPAEFLVARELDAPDLHMEFRRPTE